MTIPCILYVPYVEARCQIVHIKISFVHSRCISNFIIHNGKGTGLGHILCCEALSTYNLVDILFCISYLMKRCFRGVKEQRNHIFHREYKTITFEMK